MSKNPLEVLDMIMADVKADAERFDGQPFTGKTMAEYMGNHGAAISALARILKEVMELQVVKGAMSTKHDMDRYGGAGGGGRG